MIITFSGLDGAGKSTQINCLTKRLRDDGLRVKYVWARGGYTPCFELLKKIARSIFKKKLPKAGHSQFRSDKLRSPIFRRLWLGIAIFDLLLVWGVYVRVCSACRIIVFCDRYLNDTLLDFRQNFPDSKIEETTFWRLLKLVCPRPDLCFLFWIPVETSLKRSEEKNEPFPDSAEVLSWRLNSYLDESIFSRNRYYRVDGRGEIEEISDKLYSKIKVKRLDS